MRGLIAAVRFLTRLPTPPASAGLATAMRWFPLVGLLIGGIVAAGGWAGSQLGAGVGAAVALLLWVWVTGALHLDGLGDIADALGAAHGNAARLQEVLRDPHAGSFAVTAIALLLIVKFALLQALFAGGHYWPLALVPAVARLWPLWWARTLPPLHPGLGTTLGAGATGWPLALWGVPLLGASALAPALALAIPFAWVWGWWVRRRLGGISGDAHGAGIEIGEALLLLALLTGSAL